MVAVPLIFGQLTADDYEDRVAADPRIDQLRDKMRVTENKRFSADYLDPDKRAIGNAIQIFFRDGSRSERVEVNYPIGHRRRREEGIPLLIEKFKRNLATQYDGTAAGKIQDLCLDHGKLSELPVDEFMQLWLK